MVFKDKPYDALNEQAVQLDLSVATIMKDSLTIPLSALKLQDSVTAISFAEVFKTIEAPPHADGKALLKLFPDPAPIDEVQVKVPHIVDYKVIGERQKAEQMPGMANCFMDHRSGFDCLFNSLLVAGTTVSDIFTTA